MNLKPLLDRLKRTDAPTVEEACVWTHWHATNGHSPRVVLLGVEPDGSIRWDDDSDYGTLGNPRDPWQPTEFRPVPTVAELLALAALPGKVALESTLASIAAVESTRATDTDRDDCGECAGIHDGTLK